ncbi:hypothetical protein CC1G_08751 [Coprinopsis cinerea okayama7|uniref:Uncharacterized protein n=1 Tax=Coprinopsis cinerea (strain Okayama-7 / 130 / ATCC MYA-4618 / FGSC 9003) TaxID=240176 RepID=A8NJ11_COPC7|nr:hypothetical protein CC1G_08751 [Coprinopsis cinerea okayama7\|eukprot:XP_001834120.2 hypothetical protein CC1G_08751 [Coprinopsis cinerea okayama7\
MESSRRLADFKTCDLGDTHDLAVVDALWMSGPSGWLAVTAGQDGRVKLWDPLTGICIWSSEPILPPAVPEPCTRVVANYDAGVIAVTYRSGAIRVWSGFHFKITERTNIFPTCSTTVSPLFTPTEENETIDVLAFQIDANPTTPTLVVAFDGDHFFHRIDFIDKLESHTVTSFGEGTLGTLSAVTPCMSSDFAASRLVVTGDRLGCVGVYLWDSEPSCSPVPPVHKFEAFRDGSTITSIAWNGVTLVTGSARGITHIFDGLSLERLKVLSSPVPPFPRRGPVPTSPGPDMRAVHHILLGPNKDVIFVGVGDRVLAWKPGPVARYLRGGMRTRAVPRKSPKKVQSGSAKWSRQFEMKHHIVESKGIMDEEDRHQSHIRSNLYQQRAQLRKMGLSEDEVVQYILMMSRDEDTPTPPTPQATASTRPSINGLDGLTDEELAAALEEGMFELDYDRPITASGLVSVPSSSSSSAHTPVPLSPSRTPALRPSSSNSKVQVSPRYVPEPMQAGIEGSSPSSPTPRRPIPLGQAEHFPVVGSGTVSPASSVSGGSATSSRRNSNTSAYSETQRRPFKSAWNAPLRVSSSSTSAASPSTSPVANVIGRSPPTPSSSRIVANPVQQTNSFDDMDDDLRFALELSLAEARSRGENV